MPFYRDVVCSFTSPWASRRERIDGGTRLSIYQSEADLFNASTKPLGIYEVRFPSELIAADSSGERLKRQPVRLDDLMGKGQALLGALPDVVTKRLLNPEQSKEAATRLKVISNDARINDLAWEWLCSPRAQMPLFPVVRSIPALAPTPASSLALPLKVLLVLTNPKDERLLDPYRETQAIVQGLDPSRIAHHVVSKPTLDGLRDTLRDFEPHVVHYVGHSGVGTNGGALILHDESGSTHWLSAAELAECLPLTVRLLCLSSCFTAPNYNVLGLSRFAHAPAECRLPSVVYNRYEPSEHGITAFWQKFYGELGKPGTDLTQNVDKARWEAAVSVNPADWGAFSLLIRGGCNQPFQIEERPPSSARFAAEIQAQFAANAVNEQAGKLWTLGETLATSSGQRRSLVRDMEQASSMLSKLL